MGLDLTLQWRFRLLSFKRSVWEAQSLPHYSVSSRRPACVGTGAVCWTEDVFLCAYLRVLAAFAVEQRSNREAR